MSGQEYPTDIVLDSGRWARIHRGHGLDRDMLRADLDYAQGPRAEEVLHVEEAYLTFQPRVKNCGDHGDACDLEGDWHSHWHGVRCNDNPETHFTIAYCRMPESRAALAPSPAEPRTPSWQPTAPGWQDAPATPDLAADLAAARSALARVEALCDEADESHLRYGSYTSPRALVLVDLVRAALAPSPAEPGGCTCLSADETRGEECAVHPPAEPGSPT